MAEEYADLPSLDKDFASPIARAQLDVLLLLASSLRPHLAALDASAVDWLGLIGRLAVLYEQEIRRVSEPAAALDLWRQLEHTQDFKRAPEAHETFAQIRQEICDRLEASESLIRYLATANAEAYQWVRKLLRSHDLDDLLGEAPAPIVVVRDTDGRNFCAAAAREARSISWAWQPQRHALWSTLAATEVLQHEYLSHLVPRFEGPWLDVKEGWLFTVLIDELQEPPGSKWRRAICARFRKSLEEWMERRQELASGVPRRADKALDSSNPLGPDTIARLFQLYSTDLYWKFTGDLLRLNTSAEADRATWLINRISSIEEFKVLMAVGLQIDEAAMASGAKWPGLDTFCRRAEAIPG